MLLPSEYKTSVEAGTDHVFERVVFRTLGKKVRDVIVEAGIVWALVRIMDGDDDQAVRVLGRKRMKHQIVKRAENDCGRTNAQGEREYCDEGEAAVSVQAAKGVAEIAEEIFDVGFPAGVADFFFYLVEAAKFEAGTAAGFFGLRCPQPRSRRSDDRDGIAILCRGTSLFAIYEKCGEASSCSGLPFGRVEEQADGVAQALPFGDFGVHLAATFFRERIKFGFAAGFGFLPHGLQPAAVFEAMQRGIEGALMDLEKVFGDLAEALGYGVAVTGA